MSDVTERTGMTSITVAAQDLRYSYASRNALDCVTFSVSTGSLFGLLGPNGSGKTTTLKLLSGLLRPTTGTVQVFGAAPKKNRHLLAFHSELETLYPWLDLGGGERIMSGLYPDFQKDKFWKLVTALDVPNQRVDEMSKGQKGRLKLALTLARNAQLFLLDEPLSGIDPISRRKIMETLVGESRCDATMVISTHEIEIAQELFDRVIIVHHGRVVLDQSAAELRSQKMDIVEIFSKAIQ